MTLNGLSVKNRQEIAQEFDKSFQGSDAEILQGMYHMRFNQVENYLKYLLYLKGEIVIVSGP